MNYLLRRARHAEGYGATIMVAAPVAVLVLEGAPLGVVRRVASGSEFRCNMAAGASLVADPVTPRDKEICARIADQLAAHGLIFVGIDVIGDYLAEINVTSPTGVREIDAFAGTRMSDDVIIWLERRNAVLRSRPELDN